MYFNPSVFWCAFTGFLLICSGIAAQESMQLTPEGAYAQYFKYYTPGITIVPDEIQNATSGVVAFESRIFDPVTNMLYNRSATGFFITTFRDDNKLCFCTAKHNLFTGSAASPGTHFIRNGYWKYFGRPTPSGNPYFTAEKNQVLSGYKSALFAELVSDIPEDVVLLLVDRESIPLQSYATLGYDFAATLPDTGRLLSLGHPQSMTMRIADSLVYDPGNNDPQYAFSNAGGIGFALKSNGNNNLSIGSSGSPALAKSGNESRVVALQVQSNLNHQVGDDDYTERDLANKYPLLYGDRHRAIKIKLLEDAIKQHCWKNRTQQDIISSGDYKKTIMINNTAFLGDHFSETQTVAGTAGVVATRNATYTTTHPGNSMVTGQSVTISGSIDPGSSNSLQQIYVLAPRIDLVHTFDYTAGGTNVLELDPVVLEKTLSAAARTASTVSETPLTALSSSSASSLDVTAFPNPIVAGIVSVRVNTGIPGLSSVYTLQLFAPDGKTVFQNRIREGETNVIDVHGWHGGNYFAVIKDDEGNTLWHYTLVYPGD